MLALIFKTFFSLPSSPQLFPAFLGGDFQVMEMEDQEDCRHL